jgi:hypothetical protein
MDKRVLTRILVPGAHVQYKKNSPKSLFGLFSKPKAISNLSKSGVCFLSDEEMGRGEDIYMKIYFPDGNSLYLKGQIRWKDKDNTNNYFIHGVQFYPFGRDGRYNPLKALEYLRSLDGLGLGNAEISLEQ